jgi:hypothetical protein
LAWIAVAGMIGCNAQVEGTEGTGMDAALPPADDATPLHWPDAQPQEGMDAATSSFDALALPDAMAGGQDATTGARTLPCDVDAVLAGHCRSCHGSPPSQGAPMSLVSYDDLVRPALSDPSKTNAAMALLRMQDPQRPMPPPPNALVTVVEVEAMSGWINSGYPSGSCGTDAGISDASAPLDASAMTPDSGDPFAVPARCTSNRYWIFGDLRTDLMHPGRACITCHSANNGPTLTLAGTVYATGHEPDDCAGDTMATVVVTDANGNQITMTPITTATSSTRARSPCRSPPRSSRTGACARCPRRR